MTKILSYSIACAPGCAATFPAFADLTVVSHGGANKAAQVKAFYEPYMQQSGSRLVADEFNGEMAKVKVQVDTGSVSWDVVEGHSVCARNVTHGTSRTVLSCWTPPLSVTAAAAESSRPTISA